MLPDKYREAVEHGRKARSRTVKTLMGVFFLFSFLLLGPVLHELVHATFLEALGCGYEQSLLVTLRGVHGSVNPLCVVDPLLQLAFYSSGYLVTFLAGGALSLFAVSRDLSRPRMKYLFATGTGLVSSIILSISPRGDVSNVLRVLGMPGYLDTIVALLTALVVSITLLRFFQLFAGSERKD